MNLFPAMHASMGSWEYYVVKMTMRALSDNVKFAADVYDDKTLDDAIQRVLNESRVKKDIVTYLARQEDRFFSSIVVAAIGGDPSFTPIAIEDDPRFALFADSDEWNQIFGVLKFDGRQDYYALDGQHRLAAIKALVDPDSDFAHLAPEGFKNEEISVLVVVPAEAEGDAEFLKRYRRLFGNLNRYAKPMDQLTNIIMDEDDAIAILTRRLVSEHSFFKYHGRQRESERINTRTKNLKSSDPHFTSLQVLYEMNLTLLSTKTREINGWDEEGSDTRTFLRFRPTDEALDEHFEELLMYWDALIEEVPELANSPITMRDHSALESEGETQDSALFWPITQELFASLARYVMNMRLPNPDNPKRKEVAAAVKGLGSINWSLHSPPWRHVVLVPEMKGDRETWKMRSEERKKAISVAKRVVSFQLGIDQLAVDELEVLRSDWATLTVPALTDDRLEELWDEVLRGAL